MQQSNISHNRVSFGGVLQPLVESLERKSHNTGRLTGQDVVIHGRKDVQAIIALDVQNDIHLLIAPSGENDSRLSKLDFKGLKVTVTDWVVAGRPKQTYLDIHCSTGSMPLFKRPFLRFAEDVLFEILDSNVTPADAVYKACVRWKKFWSPELQTEVTREWIHGLFGELLFLSDLIERFGPSVIDCWTGPLAKDHDFQRGTELAVEVKTSVSVPYNINCNLRQLDSDLFKKLYIVCYRLTPVENGITLTDLVRNIEQTLRDYEFQLETFYGLLSTAGYNLQSESIYNQHELEYSSASVFHVDEAFPKITEKSFVNSLDHRISGLRYTLQLTGLTAITVDAIKDALEIFRK